MQLVWNISHQVIRAQELLRPRSVTCPSSVCPLESDGYLIVSTALAETGINKAEKCFV